MQQNGSKALLPANIAAALSQSATLFGWTSLDGIEIPFIQRNNEKFFPVRIAELKFLSQFVNVFHFNVQNPLSSYYMNEAEAAALTNSGCGEIFTTQDLLVNLEEFVRFYGEVKAKCGDDCGKKASVDGGWVQINNTVIPFIVKDESIMVALSIVRCAAGLLLGRDVPVVYPNEDECRFLNDSCKSAGISFAFTTATELVELVLMSCMCDQRPFVRQLPSGNPFSVAQPVEVKEKSNKDSEVAPESNTQPTDVLSANTLSILPTTYSGLVSDQQQLIANGFSPDSIGLQIVSTHSILEEAEEGKPVPLAVHVSPASAQAQSQAHSVFSETDCLPSALTGLKNLPLFQNPVVTSALEGSKNTQYLQALKQHLANARVQQNYSNHKNALSIPDQLRQLMDDISKKNMQVTVNDTSKANSLAHGRLTNIPRKFSNIQPKAPPSKVCRTNLLHESATDEEKQMQILQEGQKPLAIIPDSDDIRAGESLLLRRIQCYGKTITCMVKNNKLYILLEAMNRLYFPMRRLDTVIKAVTESLHVPVMTLTADEEKDFMRFYKLPAEKLNSNKVIGVEDFIRVYRSLHCMLDNSFATSRPVEPKTMVEPAPVNEALRDSSGPVPVGIPVLNVSNLKLHQLRTVACNANDQSVVNSDHFSSMPAQSQCLSTMQIANAVQFVNEMPEINATCEITSDDSIDQKPPKRRRTRVIGEVICIDD